jgi:hypothetical protein
MTPSTHHVNFRLLDKQRADLREVIDCLENDMLLPAKREAALESLHGINHLLEAIADDAFHLDVRKTWAVGIKVVTSLTPYENKS